MRINIRFVILLVDYLLGFFLLMLERVLATSEYCIEHLFSWPSGCVDSA